MAPGRGAAAPERPLPSCRPAHAATPTGASRSSGYPGCDLEGDDGESLREIDGQAVIAAAPGAETRRTRTLRRCLTIPGYAIAWLVALALAPVTLPLLWLADRVGPERKGRGRLALFGIVFLSYELAGLAASGFLWLAGLVSRDFRSARWTDVHRRLQLWWAKGLFRAAERILRLTLEVEGAEAIGTGPLVVLIRHASLADSLLPSVVLGARGVRLRYVMKRELLWDPCLDVVGQRLQNAFIRRGSADGATELAAIADLGKDLGAGEGVLLYPEGTRFTPAKRARALQRIAASERPDLLVRAQAFEAVLPPRSAGALALLDAAPNADVLFFAHSGLEGLASIADITRLGVSARQIRVRLWRVPRPEVPADRDARVLWLYDEWARVDAFVTASLR